MTAYFGALAVSITAFVVLIYIADPYSLFGSRVAPSLTQHKYFLSSFERVSKPIIVCREKPEAAILGTSRAAAGLRPAALAVYAGRTYNLALNGSYLLEIDAVLRVAAECGVTKILYGIDFFTFTKTTEKRAGEVRLMGTAFSWEKMKALAKHAVSLSAAIDSLRTIWGNMRSETPSHDETGMYINYNPADVPFQAPQAEVRQVFSDAYRTFESMLAFAKEMGIEMEIFVSPIFRSHLRDDRVYCEWLSRVTAIAGQRGVSIHNLAGDPKFAARRSDFFDVNHYKPSVGDRIIEEIYGPARRSPIHKD